MTAITGRISLPGFYNEPLFAITLITLPAQRFSWRVRAMDPPSKLQSRAELVATYGEENVVLATAIIDFGRSYMFEIAEQP